MASNVEIANRALQILGAARITSLTENSRNARSVNACFETLKLSELRKHVWNFAIKRAQLAASSTDPLFTKQAAFPLPADFVRLAKPDPEDNFNDRDWQIEGREIITASDDAPLNIRYVWNVEDPNLMDALFREALSARIARELAEEITQSNQKKADADAFYKDAIAEAKKANAFENVPQKPMEDEWITARD